MPKMKISKEFKFDSAHWLPRVAPDHKCARMHGHTYIVEIHVEGELESKLGWVLDFNDLRRHVEPLIDQLDHRVLNEIPGLENPTAEHILTKMWKRILLPQEFRKVFFTHRTTSFMPLMWR